MSKIKLEEITNDKLKDVDILWSEKYACPVYILDDGSRYIPSTGEFAGYYELAQPTARNKKGGE